MTTGRINQVTVRSTSERRARRALEAPLGSLRRRPPPPRERNGRAASTTNCGPRGVAEPSTRLPPSGTKHLRVAGRGLECSLDDETRPRRAPSAVPPSATTARDLGTRTRQRTARRLRQRDGFVHPVGNSPQLLKSQRTVADDGQRRPGTSLGLTGEPRRTRYRDDATEPTVATGNPIRLACDTGQTQSSRQGPGSPR